MLIIGFDGKEIDSSSWIVEQIRAHYLGGVILFDYNPKTMNYDKNIASPEQVLKLNTSLQAVAREVAEAKQYPVLPLLISVDYEGGNVNRLKASYGFPETISPAEMGLESAEEIERIASDMALTLKSSGFNLGFAPVVDLNNNHENPIIGQLSRAFSADAQHVAVCAEHFMKGFSRHKIHGAYKHFPGHGSSTTDSHLGFVDVTDTWQADELLPYQRLSEVPGCQMIMTAHIVNRMLDDSGLPATLSNKILTGILRRELNYDGIIITDDMQMKAISDFYGTEQSLTLAINAGADMFIFGNQLSNIPQEPIEIIDIIERQVNLGIISSVRIEESYQRIKKFKQALC